jgi:hypothetical protein
MITVELSRKEAELLVKLAHKQWKVLDKREWPVSDKEFDEYHAAGGAESALRLAIGRP